MILNDFAQPKSKFSNDKLDAVLAELCGMVIEGQQDNPDFYGMVAAAVLDPQGRLVTGVNYLYGDERIHAERAAIDKYEEEYGALPKGSIVITTLSPCCEDTHDNRYGISCTDLLNQKHIKLAYCGYSDPSQDNTHEQFTIIITGNNKIKQLCKKLADTFLKKDINEDNSKVVTRIDSTPIKDFSSNMPTYYHTKDWSQSGQFDPGSKIPKKFTGKEKGTFAGDPHRTALYATGNADETRFIEITDLSGQSYVYFDKKDLPKIRARKAYLTVFPADNFKVTNPNTGEYFSSNPGKPVKQEPITDPFQYITSQGWIVRTTDNLNKILSQAKQLHKQNKIKSYGGEGMDVQENFADGKGPGRPGDSQRHGIPKGATMADFVKASHSAGRKGQLARWQINMRKGKKK